MRSRISWNSRELADAAEDRVQQRGGEPAAVRPRQPDAAQADVVLLARLAPGTRRRGVDSPTHTRAHAGDRVGDLAGGREARLDRVHQRLVLDVAGRGDDDVRADVAAAVVGGDVGDAGRPDRLGGADHRPAQRMVGEHGPRDQVVHEVVVAVLVHRDLLEHHLALGLQLVRHRTSGDEQHVASSRRAPSRGGRPAPARRRRCTPWRSRRSARRRGRRRPARSRRPSSATSP